MRCKVLWIVLSFLMAISLVLASCTTTTEEEEEEEGGVSTGVGWWDKFGEPEYGGTITVPATSLKLTYDPWTTHNWINQYMETLFIPDWALDRDIWPFVAQFAPAEYYTGCLAVTWEWTDEQTLVINIREGIHWQDKPPVNGREFTASDVQFAYDRIMGTGSGFTEPWEWYAPFVATLEKVTATDEHTVVFKYKTPSLWVNFRGILESIHQVYESPESVELYGEDPTESRRAVGTGPFMVKEYIDDTSLTLEKNPNYWGHDERHPENQIPYVDIVKISCVPDLATRMAALRTGKLDIIIDISWEQADSLKRTNPDLLQAQLPSGGPVLDMRVDRDPFTDIRVRKALQMAIDRKTIAETHYGGVVDGTPAGFTSPVYKGYYAPYKDWPEEVKAEYSYNPERAMELLTEAGYPTGFKTNCIAPSTADLDLAQIIKAYFLDIGVDMEIRVMDRTTASTMAHNDEHDQMVYGMGPATTGSSAPPTILIGWRQTGDRGNHCNNSDPVYDAMVERMRAVSTAEEAMRLYSEADLYVIQQHWSVQTIPIANFYAYQPYLKGYSGELYSGPSWGWTYDCARWWIDQDLKESMGR